MTGSYYEQNAPTLRPAPQDAYQYSQAAYEQAYGCQAGGGCGCSACACGGDNQCGGGPTNTYNAFNGDGGNYVLQLGGIPAASYLNNSFFAQPQNTGFIDQQYGNYVDQLRNQGYYIGQDGQIHTSQGAYVHPNGQMNEYYPQMEQATRTGRVHNPSRYAIQTGYDNSPFTNLQSGQAFFDPSTGRIVQGNPNDYYGANNYLPYDSNQYGPYGPMPSDCHSRGGNCHSNRPSIGRQLAGDIGSMAAYGLISRAINRDGYNPLAMVALSQMTRGRINPYGGFYPNQGGFYPNQGGFYPNQGGFYPNYNNYGRHGGMGVPGMAMMMMNGGNFGRNLGRVAVGSVIGNVLNGRFGI